MSTETIIEGEIVINLPVRLDTKEVALPAADVIFGAGGPTAFVAYMQDLARKHAATLDPTTDSGRAGLVSAAYTLATVKTKVDDLGKKRIEEAQKIVKDGNVDRRLIREAMEALQKEVRKPVTDWEEAEEKRVADHEAALSWLTGLIAFNGPPDAAELRKRMDAFKARAPRDWEEYFDRAQAMIFHVDKTLTEGLSRQEKYEAEQAELAELRAIKAERDAKIAEDKRIAEAAEAEKKRQSDLAAAAEAARVAAEEKAERDRVAAKAAAEEAIKRAEAAAAEQVKNAEREAERKRVENEKALAAQKAQAEEAARQAQLEADRKQQNAIDDERARVERERAAREAEDARRAADLEHRKRINGQAVAALMSELAYVEDEAKELIMAIVRGKIPHVHVQY